MHRCTRLILPLVLCSACATHPVVDTNVKIDFPSDEPIKSVKEADAALEKVALSHVQIDWRFRQMEQICYTRFFMNSCMTKAKDLRRTDLAKVNKVEVAANFFKRQNTVIEMDKALVEKNVANPLPDKIKN